MIFSLTVSRGPADFRCFLPVGGFPAPFRLFQPNLTRGGSLISHPYRIFEPGAEIILNLSSVVRIRAGISIPVTDGENNSGFNGPILNLGFQFGK